MTDDQKQILLKTNLEILAQAKASVEACISTINSAQATVNTQLRPSK